MKTLSILCLLIFTIILRAQDAKTISNNALDAIKVNEFEMNSTLKILDNKGNERIRKLTTYNKNFEGINKTLIKFTYPADVSGTSILIFNYNDKPADMWIYLPSMRKTRRISGSEKSANFMGSEFKNSDMAIPNLNDFDYKLIKTELFNDKQCYVVESTPKSPKLEEEYGFSKQISFIDKNTYLTYKTEYYDKSGKLDRTQTISDYRKQINGKYFAFRMEMKNEKNNRKSILIIENFVGSCSLKEIDFSQSNLEK
ncbi:MAG: outer membrane lipoprotein-sorting protein [Flavobacterium piscis]|nr:outer membrane lipoprotein-sorting protein [Flavobacterium piscis]